MKHLRISKHSLNLLYLNFEKKLFSLNGYIFLQLYFVHLKQNFVFLLLFNLFKLIFLFPHEQIQVL